MAPPLDPQATPAYSPHTIFAAVQLLNAHPKREILVARVDLLSRWCHPRDGGPATPAMFTFHLAPLNALVTLALHDPEQWAHLRNSLLDETPVTPFVTLVG